VSDGWRLSKGRSPRAAAALVGSASLIAACAVAPRADSARLNGIELSWTAERCQAPQRDRDEDRVDDDCEFALAGAFAPELIVDPRDCLWDTSAQPARLAGGYLFAVERVRDRRAIRIAYLPAYFRDCGWNGLPCATRGAGCAAHAGDSELIVIEVSYDQDIARWTADAIFLSAHCFGRSDGRCRWYRGDELRYFAWADGVRRGAPRIYVAKGKHANYPSSRECDTGHWYYDSCDGNSVAYSFPVVSSAQNVGSRHQPLPQAGASNPAGCITAQRLPLPSTMADAGTRECFWSPMPFRGWQRDPSGNASTPYARVLGYATQF
jgi:hypothetical protein